LKTIKKQQAKGTSSKSKSKHKLPIVADNPSEKVRKVDSAYGDPLDIKLQLNTIKNSRNTLGRLIRLYADGKITHTMFRNLVYSFSHLIGFFKYDLDEEISKLWSTINEFQNRKN
jgi:hypothetical protein